MTMRCGGEVRRSLLFCMLAGLSIASVACGGCAAEYESLIRGDYYIGYCAVLADNRSPVSTFCILKGNPSVALRVILPRVESWGAGNDVIYGRSSTDWFFIGDDDSVERFPSEETWRERLRAAGIIDVRLAAPPGRWDAFIANLKNNTNAQLLLSITAVLIVVCFGAIAYSRRRRRR